MAAATGWSWQVSPCNVMFLKLFPGLSNLLTSVNNENISLPQLCDVRAFLSNLSGHLNATTYVVNKGEKTTVRQTESANNKQR